MRWQLGRRSGNVEDRRGMGRGAAVGGGGGLLVMALVVFLLGGDPTSLLFEGVQREIQYRGHPADLKGQEEQMDFVASVLGSTEDVWARAYSGYTNPSLVVYAGVVDSACGTGQSAMGPFYCRLDQKIYLDLSFFADLEKNLGAPGDFARAYVIAHEVGHHIQTLTGVSDQVNAIRKRSSEKQANALSVKMELQADCYAGIWAHYAQADYNMLEEGDIDEALNAATQIGDDRLQKRGQGYVVPDSFTHGSSAQRKEWFSKGFESGDAKSCNTFAGAF